LTDRRGASFLQLSPKRSKPERRKLPVQVSVEKVSRNSTTSVLPLLEPSEPRTEKREDPRERRKLEKRAVKRERREVTTLLRTSPTWRSRSCGDLLLTCRRARYFRLVEE
jgi:hypothetical protein